MEQEQFDLLEKKIEVLKQENDINKQRIKLLYLLIKDALAKVESSIFLMKEEDVEKVNKIYESYIAIIEEKHPLLSHVSGEFTKL
jgi:hypothetical protein